MSIDRSALMPEQSNSITTAGSIAGSTPTIKTTTETTGDDLVRMDEPTEVIREQDRLLPIANVSRIMKQAIPSNAKIAKDAKETVQECVSELIAFVTSEYRKNDISPFIFKLVC